MTERVTTEQAHRTRVDGVNDSGRAKSDKGCATLYEIRLANDLLDAREEIATLKRQLVEAQAKLAQPWTAGELALAIFQECDGEEADEPTEIMAVSEVAAKLALSRPLAGKVDYEAATVEMDRQLHELGVSLDSGDTTFQFDARAIVDAALGKGSGE